MAARGSRRTLVIAAVALLAVLVVVGIWMVMARAPQPDVAGALDLSVPAAPSLPPITPSPTPDPLPIPDPTAPG